MFRFSTRDCNHHSLHRRTYDYLYTYPHMNPPAYIQDICQVFLDGLSAALGDKLYGVYLYGAVAFPETTHTCDIDFHVILEGSLTEKEHSALVQLRERLAREFPPLGGEMDGHYLLLEDARGTEQPGSQLTPFNIDDAWALHRPART